MGMLPEIRELPWKFGVCSLEIFEWIRRLHLVGNLPPHVQMIYSLVLKYGFRENPSFTSMFLSHSTSVGDFPGPRFVPKWYLLILFPKQLSTPLVYSRIYQPVPTPEKMQQSEISEIQPIFCAYNCQPKIRRISPKVTREIVVLSFRG